MSFAPAAWGRVYFVRFWVITTACLISLPIGLGIDHFPSFEQTAASHNCAVLLGLVLAQAHATTVCVEVRFAAPLDDQRVASLRAVPFKQIRQRLYILKQKFDDEHPQPSEQLMPLVETTNLAIIMYEPPMMLAVG